MIRQVLCAAVLTLIAWVTALAYAVPELTLEQKVQQSDVVAIAKVIVVRDESATLQVETLLKGNKVATVELQTQESIAEFSPNCCKPGARYLLFVQKGKDGASYHSVNASFGVYEIPE